ncbi:hypothetical protein F2P81_008351 [Scophthalmus maximus]|uniref:Uncharacterized protein n=1 Tax=Scophthalmus maximus TaxID=52904 RepID=A0A6A4SY09_SCOMX|nr:hypothetical protein F2P81_008351 [Scophthalmus maximus]
MYERKDLLPPLTSSSSPQRRGIEMADRRRRPSPLFTFILCFSLWFTPGQTVDSFFGMFLQQCIEECPAKYFTSTYGVPCTDSCDKRGSDYYWCHSSSGWDYCSPGVNIDYFGSTCRNDHPCGNYGEKSKMCYLDRGGWSRCSQVEPKAMIQNTINLQECKTHCKYYDSGDYFWCNTYDNWDYCSPLPDITYRDVKCRAGHKCGTYGEAYSWCYTSFNDDWDYCGVIHPGECAYSQSFRRKRQPDFPNVICTTEGDNNNRRVTTFTEEGQSSIMANINNRMRNEALNLINQWDNQRLSEQARSNLISSDHLRIDNQGLINRNNQRCYNLQIQINKARGSSESTTVSQVICPLDTPADYIRTAFRRSLERQARVIVEVNDGPSTSPNNNNNNRKCCKRRKI